MKCYTFEKHCLKKTCRATKTTTAPKSTPDGHHKLKGPMWKRSLPDSQQLSCLLNMKQTTEELYPAHQPNTPDD